MSLQSSTHSSQMNTDGPAMSLRTSCWLLPQKEQYSNLPSSPLPCVSSDIRFLSGQNLTSNAHKNSAKRQHPMDAVKLYITPAIGGAKHPL
jgi:hypothetical protein